MPEELKPQTPTPAPNDAPATQPAPVTEAPPAPTDGQPTDAAKPADVIDYVIMPGNVRQDQDWSNPEFQKKVADNYWKIETFDTADERRTRRAVRKDRDLLTAALRGDENASHPLVDEVRSILKSSAPEPESAAPVKAGDPWAKFDTPELQEELEGNPVLAAAVKEKRASDATFREQAAKMAQNYKALLDKAEKGDKGEPALDETELVNLQIDIHGLTRTDHGKALCEALSKEDSGKADVRAGAAILAQEFAELITERANKGGPDPDFMKDIVEPELRAYNIPTSKKSTPVPKKPAEPKAQPAPAAGDLPRGGPGASEDGVDESKLTSEQARDRARLKFDGTRPSMFDNLQPGGGKKLRQRMIDRGMLSPK